jgi:ABC-type phosphate transport system auxiliary subunit
MALTARISPMSEAIIHELVDKTGKSKIEIIEKALECYRFQERMRLFNESYERLKTDKKAWKKELEDRQELEGTLMDGLENE